jgi:hypothetical protein
VSAGAIAAGKVVGRDDSSESNTVQGDQVKGKVYNQKAEKIANVEKVAGDFHM